MRMPSSTYLRKRMRTPHLAANIYCRNENDVTDTIFFDTLAIDGGKTCTQLFTSRNVKFTSVHAIKDNSAKSILGVFHDRIR